MKKINILLLAIVLLAFTLPVMAQVTITGEIKNGWLLQNVLVPTVKAGAKIAHAFKADENVSGNLDYVLDTDNQGTTKPALNKIKIDKASADIKILSALGLKDLPIAMTLTVGWFEWAEKNMGRVSAYEADDVVGLGNKNWNFQLDTAILDKVTVRLAAAPVFGGTDKRFINFLVGAYTTLGPVSAEVMYAMNTTTQAATASTELNGDLGAGVSLNLVPVTDLTIKVGGQVELGFVNPDNIENDSMKFKYGAGASVAFKSLIKASVGFNGLIQGDDTDRMGNVLAINAESTPIPLITIGAGMVFDLHDKTSDDEPVIDRVEGIVNFNLGKAVLGVGYNYRPQDALGGVVAKGDLYTWNTARAGGFGGFAIQSKVTF